MIFVETHFLKIRGLFGSVLWKQFSVPTVTEKYGNTEIMLPNVLQKVVFWKLFLYSLLSENVNVLLFSLCSRNKAPLNYAYCLNFLFLENAFFWIMNSGSWNLNCYRLVRITFSGTGSIPMFTSCHQNSSNCIDTHLIILISVKGSM